MDYEEKGFIKSPLKLDKILHASNLCELLTKEDCDTIGRYAKDGYERDKTSRKEWEDRQAWANKLALQVKEDKNFP